MEENKEYKYNCDNCKFSCNEISKWNKHIETVKHKTGKKKQRSDFAGPYKCEKCNYETINKTTYRQHILNNHSTIEDKKKEYRYFCELCGFGSFSKDIIDKHNLSKKHQYNLNR